MPRLAVALITCLTAFAAAAPAADAIGIIVPPPANDDWQNAANITVGSTATADTSGATTQASEPLTADPSCGDGQPANGGSRVGATVWYRITGNGRRVVVDTFGSTITTNENGTIGYDTLLAVYDGTTPSTAAGTFVECNDDFIAHGATFHSRVSFPTTQGHTYLVQAGGTTTGSSYPPDRGTIHVSLNEPPANDNRADAETLGPGEYTRSNRAGSYAADEPTSCSGTLYASTVWFRYAPATNGLAHFSSAGAPLPVLAVYDASAPTTQLGCSAASPAQVDRSLQAGHTYLVQVGGRDESSSGGGDVDPREGTLTYKLEWEPDTDNDGTLDSTDEDDDGDGTPDVLDSFRMFVL